MSDNIININNPNFFKKITFVESFDWDKDYLILSSLYLNYGVIKLIDDSGIIFSDESHFFNFKRESRSYINNYNPDKLNIFLIDFNTVMKQYERNYKKLQNVFADLGGLFNSFILIGKIIVAQINKKKFDYDLINKIFFLEKENIKLNENLNKFINGIINKNNNEKLNSERMNFNIEENSININLEEKVKSIVSRKKSEIKENTINNQASLILTNSNNNNHNPNFDKKIYNIPDNNPTYIQDNSIKFVKNSTNELKDCLSNQKIKLEDLNLKENKIS